MEPTLFIIGALAGIMVSILINPLTIKTRPPKEHEKPIDPKNPKRKHIRDYYINLTHYTADQLKEVYDILIELKEPISKVFEEYKDWWEEGYDPSMYKRVYTFDYLGFGKSSWVVQTSLEVKEKKMIELDDFIIMLRIKLIEKDNPRYKLWEYFEEQHNLILIESEIDEIIYHVNNINYGKSKITKAS